MKLNITFILLISSLVSFSQRFDLGGDLQIKRISDTAQRPHLFEISLRIYSFSHAADTLVDSAMVCVQGIDCSADTF